MPKALKSCPKSNKSPNLVTLGNGLSLKLHFQSLQKISFDKNGHVFLSHPSLANDVVCIAMLHWTATYIVLNVARPRPSYPRLRYVHTRVLCITSINNYKIAELYLNTIVWPHRANHEMVVLHIDQCDLAFISVPASGMKWYQKWHKGNLNSLRLLVKTFIFKIGSFLVCSYLFRSFQQLTVKRFNT